MADRTLSEEDSFRNKQKPVLAEQFCVDGEELLWFETPAQGYVASVIAGGPRVPHTPQNEVRGTLVPEPVWPLPSELMFTTPSRSFPTATTPRSESVV